MGKRKSSAADVDSDSEMSDSSVGKIVNLDFDFLDLNQDIDYLGIKTLLKQLFDADNLHFDLSGLTDLVLSNRAGGTTIKTDGEETDPYAFISFLDAHHHKNHPSLTALLQYAVQKSSSTPGCQQLLQSLLSQDANHLGVILSERFRNMPVETIPPLYRMLADELKGDAYQNVTHLLIISRTFHLTAQEASFYVQPSTALPPSSKRSKSSQPHQPPAPPADGLYDFHPEDSVLKEFSTFVVDYGFDREGERGDESFGLDTRGRVFVVERTRWEGLVGRLGEVYKPPGAA